jgi:Ca-activated chloride channel family protein
MILLTDGDNNAGEVDPITAAKAAAAFGMRIYTIGAGRPGTAPIPIDDPIFGRRYGMLHSRMDEQALKEIARVTGGRYFPARNTEGLMRVYEEIDRLEKTKIETMEHLQFEEKMGWVVWPGLLLLILELVLRRTWLLQIP